MTSLILKIFICPLSLMLSDWLFTSVNFSTYSQAIVIGLILAVVGTAMEYLLLRRDTVVLSTIMDFVATLLIVYFVSQWYQGANVTFWGAVLVALVVGVIEYFTHLWLVRNDKTQKSHA
jgi:uncharacterized membrane protein YvlD (DUF360 family)